MEHLWLLLKEILLLRLHLAVRNSYIFDVSLRLSCLQSDGLGQLGLLGHNLVFEQCTPALFFSVHIWFEVSVLVDSGFPLFLISAVDLTCT